MTQLEQANRKRELEIAGRKRSEALVNGQKEVLEMIATGAPLAESLTALLLRLLEAQSPDLLGSILLLDPDGVHIRHGAAPSLPEEFNRALPASPSARAPVRAARPSSGGQRSWSRTSPLIRFGPITVSPPWRKVCAPADPRPSATRRSAYSARLPFITGNRAGPLNTINGSSRSPLILPVS